MIVFPQLTMVYLMKYREKNYRTNVPFKLLRVVQHCEKLNVYAIAAKKLANYLALNTSGVYQASWVGEWGTPSTDGYRRSRHHEVCDP